MFDTIRQYFTGTKSSASPLAHPKQSNAPSHLDKFMGDHVLFNRREDKPAPQDTQHWIQKKRDQSKPRPTQWLVGLVTAQQRHAPSAIDRGIELASRHRHTGIQSAPLPCNTAAASVGGNETPTIEAAPADQSSSLAEQAPSAASSAAQSEVQMAIERAALDDYIRQSSNPQVLKPTGAIANLLDYAKTGGVFSSTKNGFQGDRRNRIGDRTFNNRFEAIDFLVRNGLTREVPERTAKAIMDLHEDLLRTEIKYHRHGAGL